MNTSGLLQSNIHEQTKKNKFIAYIYILLWTKI